MSAAAVNNSAPAENLVPKNVSQFSFSVDDKQWKTILGMAKEYCSCRNEVFARFSGIRSLMLVNSRTSFRKNVRDKWTGKGGYGSKWKIPARIRNLAIEQARANIASEWSNTKNRVRKLVRQNKNLEKEERNYINYVLESNRILEKILCRQSFTRPKAIANLTIRQKYVHNLICRLSGNVKEAFPIPPVRLSRLIRTATTMFRKKTDCIWSFPRRHGENEFL